MERLQAILRWLDERRDWCFDLVRVYLGIGLLVQGAVFASNPDLVANLLDDAGRLQASSAIIAHYVVLAHVCGGFLMAIGLVTRLAALVQIPVLFGAVFFVHLEEGLFTRQQSLEFTLLVLFLLVLTLLHGSGRWSVDYYVFEREKTAEGAHPKRA